MLHLLSKALEQQVCQVSCLTVKGALRMSYLWPEQPDTLVNQSACPYTAGFGLTAYWAGASSL